MGILRIAAIGTKAFVVGGAVYYSHDYGIWGNMKETEEGYSRLKSDLQVSVRNMNILLKKGICKIQRSERQFILSSYFTLFYLEQLVQPTDITIEVRIYS